MSSDDIRVGIADYKIGQAPHRIMTVGLGSCIGTIIYDEKSKVGGLSHIMLPDSKPFAAKSDVNPAKFADTAIPLMYQQLKRTDVLRQRSLAGQICFPSNPQRQEPAISASEMPKPSWRF